MSKQNRADTGLLTLLNVRFNNDFMDHQLKVDLSPLPLDDEESIVAIIHFLQHAFDTRKRSGQIRAKELKRIHTASQILAAVTAGKEDDNVDDTLAYADYLLIARSYSKTEESTIKEMEKMISQAMQGKDSGIPEETSPNERLEEYLDTLNREFDEKLLKVIANKLTAKDNNPDIYK